VLSKFPIWKNIEQRIAKVKEEHGVEAAMSDAVALGGAAAAL
jgi:hypothetical protein